jgi:hypothetical protein
MKKEYLLSRYEETHNKKSARVPKIQEPYYLCHHIFFNRFQKETKQERHRRKVPPFNYPRQGEKKNSTKAQ